MDARCSLKKNSDFRRLYSKGKQFVTPYMVIYCRKNRLGLKRTGYTVSTKLGHAVDRNRMRRRLREVYRLNSAAIKPGTDLVIVARSRCLKANFTEMSTAFENACRQLGITGENA